MHHLPRPFQLLRRFGWRGGPYRRAGPDRSARPMADEGHVDGWLTMDRFTAPLDEAGCSEDFWIRSGSAEVLGFFCDRPFDGKPAGWFDRFGDPVGFVPELFRRAEK